MHPPCVRPIARNAASDRRRLYECLGNVQRHNPLQLQTGARKQVGELCGSALAPATCVPQRRGSLRGHHRGHHLRLPCDVCRQSRSSW